MSDWLHCNKCFSRYSPQTTFFLVECGHIFCQRCVEKIKATKECLICKKRGNMLPLSKDVEKNVLDFFLPFESLLKKTIEVYKFQIQHRTTLYLALLNKYNYTKKEYMNCYKNNKTLMRENQELRLMLRSAGKHPQRFQTSTPMSLASSNNMTFPHHNASVMSSVVTNKSLIGRDNSAMKMRPEFNRRNQMLSGGSSQRSSSAQRVPLMPPPPPLPPFNERRNFMRPLQELCRGSKS